jgi:hypothetical protein
MKYSVDYLSNFLLMLRGIRIYAHAHVHKYAYKIYAQKVLTLFHYANRSDFSAYHYDFN